MEKPSETPIAFIICGALAREVMAISDRYQWPVKIYGIPAIDHMYPERIAQDVKHKFLAIQDRHEHILVVYGDCGSRGELDSLLTELGIDRIEGPHCYEMFGGESFANLMEEEPGTFFLTDFLVRGFKGTIWRGLGLDRYPELLEDYFRNYQRIVYFSQVEDPALYARAAEIARTLGLPLEIQTTGYGLLEERLVDWVKSRIS